MERNQRIKEEYSTTAKTMRELGMEYNLTGARIEQIINHGLEDYEIIQLKIIKKYLVKEYRIKNKVKKFKLCKTCGELFWKISDSSTASLTYCSQECYGRDHRIYKYETVKRRKKETYKKYQQKYYKTERGKAVQKEASRKYYQKKKNERERESDSNSNRVLSTAT